MFAKRGVARSSIWCVYHSRQEVSMDDDVVYDAIAGLTEVVEDLVQRVEALEKAASQNDDFKFSASASTGSFRYGSDDGL